jgi:hypothetical protein
MAWLTEAANLPESSMVASSSIYTKSSTTPSPTRSSYLNNGEELRYCRCYREGHSTGLQTTRRSSRISFTAVAGRRPSKQPLAKNARVLRAPSLSPRILLDPVLVYFQTHERVTGSSRHFAVPVQARPRSSITASEASGPTSSSLPSPRNSGIAMPKVSFHALLEI